jgi:hypothetical protein
MKLTENRISFTGLGRGQEIRMRILVDGAALHWLSDRTGVTYRGHQGLGLGNSSADPALIQKQPLVPHKTHSQLSQ